MTTPTALTLRIHNLHRNHKEGSLWRIHGYHLTEDHEMTIKLERMDPGFLTQERKVPLVDFVVFYGLVEEGDGVCFWVEGGKGKLI